MDSESNRLRGKNVLVTGGGSGMGLATAKGCAKAGARVTICGRRESVLEEAVKAMGPDAAYVVGDLVDPLVRNKALETAQDQDHGLYALVHCAGDLLSGPVAELDQDTVTRVLNNNVTSPLMLTSEAVGALAMAKGSVVFISSAHVGRAFANSIAYAGSKGAIETMTRALAAELSGRDIRVNCVRPGAVDTAIFSRSGMSADMIEKRLEMLKGLHPIGRVGEPDDIAAAILYLISAEWATGSILTVDGGLTLGI